MSPSNNNLGVGITCHSPAKEEEEMREIAQAFAVHLPMLIACVLMLIASAMKIGKEKGARLIVTGAVVLVLLVVILPLVDALILPRMLEEADIDTDRHLIWWRNIASSLFWTVAIGLIAVGTFVRQPMKGEGHQRNA
ncbi:MAG: hypothetical protein ACON5J_14345 [Rubripirellula sp.]